MAINQGRSRDIYIINCPHVPPFGLKSRTLEDLPDEVNARAPRPSCELRMVRLVFLGQANIEKLFLTSLNTQ